MGSKERRERERAQQRKNILDAALKIISKEGFAALSMRKLAEEIEYSAASIYLHFENREQIAQELSEIGFRELLQALSQASEGKQGADALHALGAAYVKFGLRHAEMYRLIFMGDSDYMKAAYGESNPDTAAAQAFAVLLDVARQLTEGTTKLAPQALTATAELIWSTLHGIVSLHITCANAQSSTPETLVRYAMETLAKGLTQFPQRAEGRPKGKVVKEAR